MLLKNNAVRSNVKSKLAVLLLALAGFAFSLRAREVLDLDAGWRFQLADVSAAEKNGTDDSTWEMVSLPHNWGWREAQEGKSYYRGPGWYRRELKINKETGKRYFLKFDAASLVADVYLNGKLIGQHRGGFGAFCFEITRELAGGSTNLLAVRVDNSKFPDIAPLEGDFSVYGGLYRPVHLVVTGEENISPTDHGSPGVTWRQSSVTPTQALLAVTAQISNGTRHKRPLKLNAKVVDAAGAVVTEIQQDILLAPRDTAPYYLNITVPQPHLWNGRQDPYLYRAVVELCETNDVVLDRVEQPLGLRYFSVDPDKGFYLNGQPYHLHGVNRHQDFLNKGWAITEADMDLDLSLIKELGATVVRCAHYQHSDYFYSQCDRAGILVWAEIPQVNIVRDTPEFGNTSRNQLLDLIRQNLNHPSVFVWSLGNEIGSHSDDPHRELQDLDAIAHGEDPTRLTVAATMTDARPQMNRIPDLLGWNIYPGWYSGAKEDYGRMLDARRASSRSGGLCVSEYGAGANPAQHEPNPDKPKPTGQWHPEEWQADVHEAAWAAMKQRPFVWGTFVWCMFDFAVSTRHEGGVPGLNDKGLVTRDRQTRKDAFYFYQANWSDEPVLYITDRRFVERTNALADVKVYSNSRAVKLFLNGQPCVQPATRDEVIFEWKQVRLSPGTNEIRAVADFGARELTDRCQWNLQ